MKFLFYILLMSSLFLYCCKRKGKYYYISGTERLVYEKGDTLIYRSNNDKKDTLIVCHFDESRYIQTVSSNDCNDYYQVEDLTLCGIKKSLKKFVSIMRSAAYGSYPENVGIFFQEQVGSLYPTLIYGFDFFADSMSDADTLYSELQIENKIYKKVFYSSFENAINLTNKIPPRKYIYYNHTYGLLRYDLNDETWSLYEIKPER